MLVTVRTCRDKGQRLNRSEWSQPTRGDLFVGPTRRGNRILRIAELTVSSVQWKRSVLQCIFDVEMQTFENGFVLKGYEVWADGGRVSEHRQIWFCVPARA